jgi:hypothetical protein
MQRHGQFNNTKPGAKMTACLCDSRNGLGAQFIS